MIVDIYHRKDIFIDHKNESFIYLLTYLLTTMIKMKEKRRKFINQSEFQYIFQDP